MTLAVLGVLFCAQPETPRRWLSALVIKDKDARPGTQVQDIVLFWMLRMQQWRKWSFCLTTDVLARDVRQYTDKQYVCEINSNIHFSTIDNT